MFNSLPVHIRPAALIFISVIAVVIASVATSMAYRNGAEQSENAASRAMRIWKNKIDASRQNDRIIDKYEHDYLDLVKNNIIGEENRLSWFETIQHVSNERNIASVKYSVNGQKKLKTPALSQKYGGLVLYDSGMTLDTVMGHEGDLFALLNALQDRAKGLFTVDSCNLELSHPNNIPVDVIGTNQMKAHCELSWYTIQASK